MPSTFFGLSIAKSGLYASMGGINTTAHNISHTNTEGYCRQVMGQTAGSALRVNSTYGMAGSGVDITGVEQMRDIYYDLKFRRIAPAGQHTDCLNLLRHTDTHAFPVFVS